MRDDEKGMFKVYNDYFNRDINSLLQSLVETNKLIVTLSDSFHTDKVQFRVWKEHLEILLLKYSFHSSTLVKLIEGTEVSDLNNETKIFQDIPSIRVILRAIIENYLTLKYLFFDPETDSIGEFRYYLYQISGLNSRQKFDVYGEQFKEQSEREKQKIIELEKLISENDYFKNLDNKTQKNILKTKSAREFGWEKMIENSDLKSDFFKPIWKLFSNTAHSELIGAIQFKGFITTNSENLENELVSNIFSATILNACLISSIKESYPTTLKIFQNNSIEFNAQIDMWTNIARNKINK